MKSQSLIAAALVLGCAGETEAPPLPWEPLLLPEAPIPDDNPMSEEKVLLGNLLFHDPILSSDRAVACVTCHGQIWGLSDGLPRSVGIGGEGPAGTGRTGPNVTRRNSQTLWNAAFRSALFWDGRAASLEHQVLFPIEDPKELGRLYDEVVADLTAIPEYVGLFEAAFPGEDEPVTLENLQKAIAAFERTLVSDNAPYDRYVKGDALALSEEQVRGMFLFAEVGCADCHTPPLFESDAYEDIGVPPVDGVEDRGRAEVTRDPADEGRFRVPTLRNIRETGPYFHTGEVASLEEALDHQASRPLSPDEIAAIAAFLAKGLMDKSREPHRPLVVPSGLEVPKDGYSVPR